MQKVVVITNLVQVIVTMRKHKNRHFGGNVKKGMMAAKQKNRLNPCMTNMILI